MVTAASLFPASATGSDDDPVLALLEGKTFVGGTGPMNEPGDSEDEVGFRNGRFLSISCSRWGFDPAAYQATIQMDGIHFKSLAKSPKHGQILWQGIVSGGTITATYLWTKERWYWFDAREERWFRGKLKPE
jgi:hypothetical protein